MKKFSDYVNLTDLSKLNSITYLNSPSISSNIYMWEFDSWILLILSKALCYCLLKLSK